MQKSVFSYLHTLKTWHCPHSPAACRYRSNQSISPASRLTAANLQQPVCCCGPMLGQTDGWTPYRYIDPVPHTSANKAADLRQLMPYQGHI